MVEGRSAGDGFLFSVCNSSERLLHEKKGLFHKMTQAVPLSRLWACTRQGSAQPGDFAPAHQDLLPSRLSPCDLQCCWGLNPQG